MKRSGVVFHPALNISLQLINHLLITFRVNGEGATRIKRLHNFKCSMSILFYPTLS